MDRMTFLGKVERWSEVLEYISSQDEVTAREVSVRFGISSNVYRLFQELRDFGLIRQDGYRQVPHHSGFGSKTARTWSITGKGLFFYTVIRKLFKEIWSDDDSYLV